MSETSPKKSSDKDSESSSGSDKDSNKISEALYGFDEVSHVPLTKLKKYRDMVDTTDKLILTMLAERCNLVKRIGKLKATIGTEVEDKQREDEVIKNIKEYNQESINKSPIDDNMLDDMWQVIFKYSKELQ